MEERKCAGPGVLQASLQWVLVEEEDGVFRLALVNFLWAGFMPAVKEEGPRDIEDRHIREEMETWSLSPSLPDASTFKEYGGGEYLLAFEYL